MEDDIDIAITPETEETALVSFLGSTGLHEFIRYFGASAIALALDTGILWFLTSILSVPYLLSGAIAFTAGLVAVYYLSVNWVFENRLLRNSFAEFTAFALIGLVGLIMNELILWLFTSIVGFYYLSSKIFSVLVVFTWNYTARRTLLFRTSTKS